MGDFPGHAAAGTIWILYGFWHFLNITARFLGKEQQPFRSSIYFTICGVPLESVAKLLGMITAMYQADLAHLTIYACFASAAFLELLDHYRFHLPPKTTYLTTMLAFANEAVQLQAHNHGRHPVDAQLHQILIGLIVLTVVALHYVHTVSTFSQLH